MRGGGERRGAGTAARELQRAQPGQVPGALDSGDEATELWIPEQNGCPRAQGPPRNLIPGLSPPVGIPPRALVAGMGKG